MPDLMTEAERAALLDLRQEGVRIMLAGYLAAYLNEHGLCVVGAMHMQRVLNDFVTNVTAPRGFSD